MSIFDLSLLLIIGGFVVNGLFKGLIRLIGQVVGLILGSYLATHFYLNFYDWFRNWSWLKSWILGREGLAQVIAFIILFVVAARLIDLFFVMIEKIFKFVAIIPGSKYLDNLLGAALGFLEGALFLGLIIYVASRYTLADNLLGGQLSHSTVAPILSKVVDIILPLLPAALKTLKSVII